MSAEHRSKFAILHGQWWVKISRVGRKTRNEKKSINMCGRFSILINSNLIVFNIQNYSIYLIYFQLSNKNYLVRGKMFPYLHISCRLHSIVHSKFRYKGKRWQLKAYAFLPIYIPEYWTLWDRETSWVVLLAAEWKIFYKSFS